MYNQVDIKSYDMVLINMYAFLHGKWTGSYLVEPLFIVQSTEVG